MKYKGSTSFRVFNLLNIGIVTCAGLVSVLPMIHMLAISLSAKAPANAGLVGLWPIKFTWNAYGESLVDSRFIASYEVTAHRIILGTIITMLLTVLTAYPLSKEPKAFPYRNLYVWFMVFTMLFSGGLIPTYMLVTQLGLINSIWALVLPEAVNTFNIVLLLNFFRQLPKELEESALMDGAGQFTIMGRIYLPLSLPALATVTLFTLVGHWNAWFDGLIYMNDSKLYPLQTYLQILLQETKATTITEALQKVESSETSLYNAKIFMAILPIVLVYPFLQKYFVKGIVLGSVKE